MSGPTWADPEQPVLDRVRALLDAPMSRGDVKRAGAQIERDPALRSALVSEAQRRGLDVDPSRPGKHLLRRCRDRASASQVRTNPIARDEPFTCAHCGSDIPAHGRTARDHCPRCLRSLHVDIVPGDRAATCGGLMDPIAAEGTEGAVRLTYRCRRCGHQRANRALLDGDLPDNRAEIRALMARAGAAQ